MSECLFRWEIPYYHSPAASPWHPFAQAPKDGQWVTAWDKQNDASKTIRWNSLLNCWIERDSDQKYAEDEQFHWFSHFCYVYPPKEEPTNG